MSHYSKALSLLAIYFYSTHIHAQFSDLNFTQFVKKQKHTIVDSFNIAYIDEGEGDALLLVHGVPTSSWLYRKQIDSLVAKNFRVIVPDLLGYGQSDKPKDLIQYTHDHQAKILMGLMKNLGIKSWNQICHDMGSLPTWLMIDMDTSQQIKSLVILNSILKKEGFNPPMKFRRGFWGKSYAKLYCNGLSKSMVKGTLKNGLQDKKVDDKTLEGYVKPLNNAGHYALYYFFTSFKEMDAIIANNEERLKNYKGNISFIWGKNDKILTVDQINHFKNLQNVKKVTILEKSKHFIQEEELSASLLIELLTK